MKITKIETRIVFDRTKIGMERGVVGCYGIQ
jgi:hypothetical protein